MTEAAYVGFGANLGHPREMLDKSAQDLEQLFETSVLAISSLYRSSPIGTSTPQPDYYNAVIELKTNLPAEQLLTEMLRIESAHGRIRPAPANSARILDLDLLLYSDLTRSEPYLTLPHPRIQERAFVLYPLTELAPEIIIPGIGRAADHLPLVSNQNIERV